MEKKALIFNIVRGSFCDGYGIRTTVFLKGCPLKCLWCCNVEGQSALNELKVSPSLCDGCGECIPVCGKGALSVSRENAGRFLVSLDRGKCDACGRCVDVCFNEALDLFAKPYTVDELFRVVNKDRDHYLKSGGGVTIGGGEATMQAEFTYAFMKKCQENGIQVGIDTCGYTTTELGFRCLAEADLLLYDLKHMDSEVHQKLTGVPNETIISNLIKLNELRKRIIIRIPLIPGYNDSQENLHASAKFLSGLRSVERLDLIGYHNYSKRKYEQLGKEYLLTIPAADESYVEKIKELFEHYGLNVQIGG